MRRTFSVWVVFLVLMVGFGVGIGVREGFSSDNIYDQINKFKDVLLLTQKFYIDEAKAGDLTEGAIQGLLERLDPHSAYLPARTFERVMEEQVEGKYQGVGLAIRSLKDTIIVVEPMGGGPAALLGILSNDRIVAIQDSTAVRLSVEQASRKLRGPKGTKVKVTIVRPGIREPLVYEITRDEIALNSVDVALLMPGGIGYVNVNKFSMTTTDDLKKAMQGLRERGMTQCILDLRGNPGGIMEQAVAMADLFLDAGSGGKPRTIVYTKARRPEMEESFVAATGQEFERIPLIVLINNASASASEIVAGAIQDWDRGLVVGETSFGKGLVQRQWPLNDGSALRLTVAKYYTPSGRLIQRPYEGRGRSEYHREAFERDEPEGENMDHGRDVTAADSARPSFRTSRGRVVYGGGGITPDYIVKPVQLTSLTQNLFRRDMFYQFVTEYLDANGKEIRRQYAKNLPSFMRSYAVSDEMVEEFRSFLKKNEIEVEQEEMMTDLIYIKARLKAYLARNIWGNEGWYSVMLEVDPHYQKAATLFPEAERIARLQ